MDITEKQISKGGTMELKEFVEEAGRILGVKSGKVEFAIINMRNDDHLNQRISLGIRPSKYQAKKLRDLAYKFGQVSPMP